MTQATRLLCRALSALMLVLTPLLATACSAAESEERFPYFEEDGGRVRDGAEILSRQAEARIAGQLDAAQAAYGQQVAVVTVGDLHGYDIADFSLEYANAWGLGDAERDDGLLFLIAPNDRRVRIEVGKGLEDTFPDAFCAEILEETVLPAFQQGQFEAGIASGVNRLVERMEAYPSLPAANDNQPAREKGAA